MTARWYRINEHHEAVPINDQNIEEYVTYLRWFESGNNRQVALDQVGSTSISTVFLGLDHQYGDGPPILFETMAFRDGEEVETQRYHTWTEAEAGHQVIVSRVRQFQDYQTQAASAAWSGADTLTDV